jgi:predicted nucleic acid-binding protein
MRSEGRRGFGLFDGIIYEIARAVGAVLVTGDPHFREVPEVRYLRGK